MNTHIVTVETLYCPASYVLCLRLSMIILFDWTRSFEMNLQESRDLIMLDDNTGAGEFLMRGRTVYSAGVKGSLDP